MQIPDWFSCYTTTCISDQTVSWSRELIKWYEMNRFFSFIMNSWLRPAWLSLGWLKTATTLKTNILFAMWGQILLLQSKVYNVKLITFHQKVLHSGCPLTTQTGRLAGVSLMSSSPHKIIFSSHKKDMKIEALNLGAGKYSCIPQFRSKLSKPVWYEIATPAVSHQLVLKQNSDQDYVVQNKK